ncbi:MAG: BsuPI-related putative proteinase inhibitor [Gemmatimonadetes bacterium]|nr:BsuPI-related putative proteinase inhibitor [Gemmatimonadota bacterium]
MNGRLVFASLSFTALGVAFACGPRPRNSDVPRASHARAKSEAKLTPTLDINVKDGVQFAFRVTNTGDAKVELNFPSGLTHDLVVVDSAGREVWRWSQGRFFTQSLQSRVLRSSDALDYDARWDSIPQGRYTAIATLASDNYPVVQRADFVVR